MEQTNTQKKADSTSMTKLSVENTMLKEKLKEQKKLVISLQKHKRKLEHQVEAFWTNEQQSSVLEKVHSKLDLIYGTVQRMPCSTANPLLSHTLSAIQFWCPIASNYPKKRGAGSMSKVQNLHLFLMVRLIQEPPAPMTWRHL